MAPESTGYAPFAVGDKECKTWYKIVGDIKDANRRPLVALHGGPGSSHNYLLPHAELFSKCGCPVVFYDQLGCGNSTHLPDAPATFWTPGLYMDELDNLLKHLGIRHDFDLLGQSWGGMLGAQYAATRSHNGLKRLIIANSPASMELFIQGTNKLLDQLPSDVVALIRKHEAEGTTDTEEYENALTPFYHKHLCSALPWPQTLVDSFIEMKKDPSVYHHMNGPSEFTITGTLKNWSIIDDLHNIACPTLLISAPMDEVQEPAVLPFFLKVPKIKWVQLQNSSHLGQYEEPERYFHVISDFLIGTENSIGA